MTGAYGTLGVMTELSLRLHPRPQQTLTVVAPADDPLALVKAASDLAHLPLEAERLDLRWEDGAGTVLIQLTGPSAPERADMLDGEVVEDDDALWAAQREAQRGPVVLRVSTTQQGLARVVEAGTRPRRRLRGARCPGSGVAALRGGRRRPRRGPAPAPRDCVLLDAPRPCAREVDPWGGLRRRGAHAPRQGAF